MATLLAGCASISMPEPKVERYSFPSDHAHVGDVKRPYDKLGQVRSKIDYQSLDPNHDELDLCRNYYNQAVRDLVKRAKEVGGEAVIDVRSVVFYEDGRSETFQKPECSDDGQEGQVLVQAIAVKWKPVPAPSVTPTAQK